jgi:uncharacterized protein HemY
MLDELIPLSVLALIIIIMILGTAWLVWMFSAEGQDARRFKRENKGRRKSDQY